MKTKYEIYNNGKWQSVSQYIFRSWDGKRKKNGKLYYGKVYKLGEK